MSRRAGCPTRKVAYGDLDQAVAAALRVSRTLGPLRAYPCNLCPGVHLTRQARRT